MKKRIFALLLAALMIVSLLPVTALADNASVTIEYKGGSNLEIKEDFSNLESIGLNADWSFTGSKNDYTNYPYFGSNGHLYIKGGSSSGSSVTVAALDGQNILSIELSLKDSGSPAVSANDAEVTGENISGKMVYSFGDGCTSFTVARGTQNVEITTCKVNYVPENAPQKELVSRAIQGTPAKTEYTVGESFDPTGLTVQATYSDEDVTENAAFTVVPETFTEAGDNASVDVTAKVGTETSSKKTINNIKVKAPAPAPTTYAITNGTPESDAEKNHGYIAIDKKTAAEGETVTITVNPADGYELKSLTVTPEAKTISTIADVLATVEGGFPEGTGGMKDCPDDAWVNNSDRYTFVVQSGQNSALSFYYSGYVDPSTGTQGNATFVLTTTGVTPGENCYTATSGNNTLTFNMTDGKLTGIVFSSTTENARNWYGGTYTAPAGTTPTPAKLKPITPEKQTDGTYTFTMPAEAVTVTAEFASTYSPETRDEHGIITKPADGTYVVYNRLSSNTSLYLSGSTLYLLYQSGRATMVECADGTVYWQNPISMFTSGAWIKGTREGNTITFPAGQPVIYSKDYDDATLSVCWGYFNPNAEDPEDVWTRVDNYQQGNIVFEIDGDTLTMQGTSVVMDFKNPFYFPGIFWDDDNSFNGYGDCGVDLTYVQTYSVTNGTPKSKEGENHGYITINTEAACEGDFVTVQVWPARNYLLNSLSYQGEGDPKPITISRSMLGSFQFQMPNKNVTVTATFEAGPAEFITADTDHPVYDKEDFEYYKIGETMWRGYPFAGWFYEDGGTEKEFTGCFADAVPGTIYTARWKNAAGKYVLTDGITVDAKGVYIGETGIYAATDRMTGKTTPTDRIVSLTAPSGEDKLGVQPTIASRRINSDILPNDTFAAGADSPGGTASNTELENYGIRFTPAQNGKPATLTLENASIEAGNGADTYYSYSGGQEIYAGIFSTVPLQLVLDGENTVCITRSDSYNCAYGIFGGDNVSLTVTGSKLTADASQANGYQTGGLILNGGALTNSATLDGVGGNGYYASYGVSCGYLTNTAGELTGEAGSAMYANGVNLTVPSVISGGKVIGYGGAGTGEYYGLWANQSLNVSDTGVLELHGGTQTGRGIKEALYLENEYATITIAGSGKLVADSTVKNDGSYEGKYTVTGAQTDIAAGKGLNLTKTGDTNIEITAKTYTVTFNANGGAPVPASVTTMAYITEPSVPEKSGSAFAGWFKDSAFTQAWDFENDYVRANTTLYAKWVKQENTGTVSGTVKDESDTPVDEADVYLTCGNIIKTRYTTGSDGVFSFTGVPAGEYQLVATDGTNTTTALVTVASDGTVTGDTDVKLYTTSKTSSTVEITGKDTPDVMVGGLAAVALANKDDGSADVTVTLMVESKTAENVNPEDKGKIETAAGSGKTLAFIDMTLLKTVGDAVPTPITDTEDTLLEVVIPYDLSNKSNIALYRQHDDAASELPEGEANAVDGEYVTIDKANNRIRAHLRYFSTYAIGYAEQHAHSSSVSSYAVALPASVANGKVDVRPKNATVGQTVTVTVTPEEGYKLNELTAKDAKGSALTLAKVNDTTYTFKMPASKVTVSASFAEIAVANACPKDTTCPVAKFTDTDTRAWYHDGVHFCVENGYMQGVSDTKFSPSGTLSRAMIVTMLWRMEGEPVVNYALSFKDVPAGQWYTEAIRWAQSNKIVEGYNADTFDPNDNVTREQLAAILYRYAQSKGQGFTGSWMFLLDFVDRADISSWADEAVHWCSMKGVVGGKDGKVFDPQGNATRAEAATMFRRYCALAEE